MNKTKKRIMIIAAFLVIAVAAVCFLPVWPVSGAADDVTISDVDLYYKGQPEGNLNSYLKLNDLELMLKLFNTSLIPTESRGHQVSEYYYVISGIKNSRSFTITADSSGAYMLRGGSKTGWRLKNGGLLQGMIYSSAYDEYKEQLQSLAS